MDQLRGEALKQSPTRANTVSQPSIRVCFGWASSERARPGWGRERAPALGSEGVRAVERAAGVETGEGFLCFPPAPPPRFRHAGWRKGNGEGVIEPSQFRTRDWTAKRVHSLRPRLY
jgi:hypothetical protein